MNDTDPRSPVRAPRTASRRSCRPRNACRGRPAGAEPVDPRRRRLVEAASRLRACRRRARPDGCRRRPTPGAGRVGRAAGAHHPPVRRGAPGCGGGVAGRPRGTRGRPPRPRRDPRLRRRHAPNDVGRFRGRTSRRRTRPSWCSPGTARYKLKKPVNFDFLDFSTRERREQAAHREVELNRRIAPDVYLGVADVLDVDGSVCDHLLVMRRLPSDRRLSTLVTSRRGHRRRSASGRPDDRVVPRTSRSVRAAIDAAGAPAHVAAKLALDLAGAPSLRGFDLRPRDARRGDRTCDALRAGTCSTVRDAGRGGMGARRARRPPRRRHLLSRRRPARASTASTSPTSCGTATSWPTSPFWRWTSNASARPSSRRRSCASTTSSPANAIPSSLVDYYVAFRALIRAKVSAIRVEQGDENARQAATGLLELARAHLRAGRVSDGARRRGTGHREDHRSRKGSAGAATGPSCAPTSCARSWRASILGCRRRPRIGEGLYSHEMTRRTYDEMLRRARVALELGQSVVLDAVLDRRRAPARRAGVSPMPPRATWSSCAVRSTPRSPTRASNDGAETTSTPPTPTGPWRRRCGRRPIRGREPRPSTPRVPHPRRSSSPGRPRRCRQIPTRSRWAPGRTRGRRPTPTAA